MKAQYTKRADGSINISVDYKLVGEFEQQEDQIAEMVNEVGRLAYELAMKGLDLEGQPIIWENDRYTSKGEEKKTIKRRMVK